MADQKDKTVWVKAKTRGQNPTTRAIVDENSPPFRCPESIAKDARWMTIIEGAAAKALDQGASEDEAQEVARDDRIKKLEEENSKLVEKVESLAKKLEEMTTNKKSAGGSAKPSTSGSDPAKGSDPGGSGSGPQVSGS